MKAVKIALKTRLASVSVLVLVSLFAPLSSMAQQNGQLSVVPEVPHVVNPNHTIENDFQRQSHFLSFVGSYIPESAASAKAYYKAIDPNNLKATFPQWLVKAGFIQNEGQWHAFGKQKFACALGTANGCDYPAGTYGDNIINTDSHVIVLNAADLGFVRNQFIRCDPSCTAANPKIYTYLENYPVAAFTKGGTNFGLADAISGYPSLTEAKNAMNAAITRPLGTFTISDNTFHPGDYCDPDPTICVERIADVAFEWAPPATNPTSSSRFGQLYAYIFAHDPTCVTNQNPNHICETTDFPTAVFGKQIIGSAPITDFKAGNGSVITIQSGDKFAPNLDGIGFKQHPGVCLVCHGGAPTNLTSSGAYPRGGNINGFRFLPLDIRNLLFTSDLNTADPLSRISQEPQIKQYNLAVLRTVPKYAESDGTGAVRITHLREVVTGWYSPGLDKYSNDTSMSGTIQKSDWIPRGWREAPNGTAPAHAEDLYEHVVGPSCRTCHFNRELSLDFGTYANFHQESDLQQLSLLAKCKQNNDADPKAKFMPLALLTFVRFWETQNGNRTLGDGASKLSLNQEVDRLARDFGFSSVDGYCATNP